MQRNAGWSAIGNSISVAIRHSSPSSAGCLAARACVWECHGPLSIASWPAPAGAPDRKPAPGQRDLPTRPNTDRAARPTRAATINNGNNEVLFISGTASIVGHATLHHGDVIAQTRETVANLAIPIEQANLRHPTAPYALQDLIYRVYVRHAHDYPLVRTTLEQLVGNAIEAAYLQADVCRTDLLVEIEALAFKPLPEQRHERLGPALLAALCCYSAGSGAEQAPLWEAGIGVAALTLPAYRGADKTHQFVLPLPHFTYRGDIFKADRHGVRGQLFDSDRVDLTVSASASPPTRSDDVAARANMPDLQPTVELGFSKTDITQWRSGVCHS